LVASNVIGLESSYGRTDLPGTYFPVARKARSTGSRRYAEVKKLDTDQSDTFKQKHIEAYL
jgi:hypothetical protein